MNFIIFHNLASDMHEMVTSKNRGSQLPHGEKVSEYIFYMHSTVGRGEGRRYPPPPTKPVKQTYSHYDVSKTKLANQRNDETGFCQRQLFPVSMKHCNCCNLL